MKKNDMADFAGFDKTMGLAGPELSIPPVIPAVKIVPE